MSEEIRRSGETEKMIIEAVLAIVPEVKAVYLFGSFGTSLQRAESDVDIALMPFSRLSGIAIFGIAGRLAGILGRDVDLIDLSVASTVLRAEIFARGERIFCLDEPECERFEDFALASYCRLNEERAEILSEIKRRGRIHA